MKLLTGCADRECVDGGNGGRNENWDDELHHIILLLPTGMMCCLEELVIKAALQEREGRRFLEFFVCVEYV